MFSKLSCNYSLVMICEYYNNKICPLLIKSFYYILKLSKNKMA